MESSRKIVRTLLKTSLEVKICFFFLVILIASLPFKSLCALDSDIRKSTVKLGLTHRGTVRIFPRYDPFSSSTQIQKISASEGNFTVTFQNAYPNIVPFFLTFSFGNGSVYERYLSNGQHKLSYQLYADESLSYILSDIISSGGRNILVGETPPYVSGRIPFTYFLAVDQGQFVPPGNYSDKIVIRLFEGYPGSNIRERASRSINYKISVPEILVFGLGRKVSRNFGALSSSQTLSFGDLIPGATLETDIFVLANTGYSLSISSARTGKLKNMGRGSDSIEYEIPYTLNVNDKNIDLSSTREIVFPEGTDINGTVIPVKVTIGEFKEKMAGKYQDVIRITAKSI